MLVAPTATHTQRPHRPGMPLFCSVFPTSKPVRSRNSSKRPKSVIALDYGGYLAAMLSPACLRERLDPSTFILLTKGDDYHRARAPLSSPLLPLAISQI
jgi:hypothetical protein